MWVGTVKEQLVMKSRSQIGGLLCLVGWHGKQGEGCIGGEAEHEGEEQNFW